MIKIVLNPVFLVLCLSYQILWAQPTVYSKDEIKGRFEELVTNVHQEKVFLHLDRDTYITGETIWFSAYCVDAATHVPVDISKVLNLELLDQSGQAVKQICIRLTAGFGKGQVFVSPDLPSGHYRLRAYTNWMKNFDPELVFQQDLKVINPSSITEAKSSDLVRKPTIKLFPEGGHLVAGLKSKVAMRATDGFGNGLQIAGIVYDNQDREVAEFATSKSGYTHFFITPAAGRTYAARVEFDSVLQDYPLPAVQDTGLVMSADTDNPGVLKISVDHSTDFQSNLYLVVHTRGIMRKIQLLSPEAAKNIDIPMEELLEGISHITLLSEDFTPLCERLVFKYPEDSQSINLNLDHQQIGPRDKMTFQLSGSGSLKNDQQAQLSVSVARSMGAKQENRDIVSSLLLTSDLKGSIPGQVNLTDKDQRGNAQLLDLILLTHGWRRFDWNALKQDQNITINYPAEINAPILSGQIKVKQQQKLPKALQVNFLGKAAMMNSTGLDQEGRFNLEVPFRVSTEKVLFFINEDTLSSDQVTLFSPFDLPPLPATYFGTFDPNYKQYLETLNTNIQISQVYRDHNHINGLPEQDQQTFSTFYGVPDHLYLLDDFTRFETVEDLFIEYIRSAVIRDNRRTSGFFVIYDNGLMPNKALTLIDGVPIFDFDYMMNFDPLVVEKIGVVTESYRMGNIEYAGIIDFTTYQGDFDGQDFPDYIVEKVYHGLQQPRSFYTPDYSERQNRLARIPDYRNTLYWNPQVEIKGGETIQLDFYTSDEPGLYRVQANGITDRGKPISLQTEFEVVANP